MIRFINLGNQIYPLSEPKEGHMFAWWNTVFDRFMGFMDTYVWETWEEFECDYHEDKNRVWSSESYPIERFRGLFPDYWKSGVDNREEEG